MSDQQGQFSKNLLLEVKIKADSWKAELPVIRAQINQLIQDQQHLISTGAQNSQAFKATTEELKRLNTQYSDNKKSIADYRKAVKLENDSINQNKALVALLTTEYERSGKAKDEDAERISNLNGHLKKQEGELTKTTNKTVEYANAIAEAAKTGIDALPGGEQLTAVLGSLAKGFNVTGMLAGDAAEALETTGEAASTAGGPFTAAIELISVLVGWLMKFTPIAEKVARIWAGVTGAFSAFANTLKNRDGFGNLIGNMKKAYAESAKLEGKIQDMERKKLVNEAADSEAEAKIAELESQMKDSHASYAKQLKAFKDIQKTNTEKYTRDLATANEAYDNAVSKAVMARGFTKEEIDTLREKGIAYAVELDKKHGLVDGKSSLEEILKTKQNLDKLKQGDKKSEETAQAWADQQEQKRKQRADQARADHEKAVEAGKKAAEIRAKGREAERKANEEQEQSVKRMLELKMSDFAKELSSTDEHYRQMEREQRNFIETYNNMKGAERAANEKAYRISLKNIEQLHKEHFTMRMKQITDFNRDMADSVQAADNELENLKISNLSDEHERQIAEYDQQEKEKVQDLEKRHTEESEKQKQWEDELAAFKAKASSYRTAEDKKQYTEELNGLQRKLDKQLKIVKDNEQAQEEVRKYFKTKREKSQTEYEDGKNAKADNAELDKLNADVTEKGKKAKPFLGDKDLLAAQEKALNKKYQLEIAAAEKAGESTYTLKLQQEGDLHKLHEDFAKKREELAIGSAKKVAEKGFSILKNSIKSASEVRLKSLDEDKSRELANTSLTSAQKKAVEEKYKKKQLEEKVKAFRAEQKASIAQALINGALAMTKVAAETGILSFAFSPLIAAQTAVAVATILRQKPPAYALGGVHGRRYASDGRGGVLPGYSRYDNVNAFLRDGEGIVVSEAMRNPYARQMVSDINQSFGGRAFAAGGVFSNSQYLPTTSNPARMQPVINANIDYGKLAAVMASMPPPIMDIKDVNTQQQRLAQSESRANL
ncbi:hypothetical protein [Mucilaginibacter sp. CSA2-8R]|uniref:hypothetical protein n=1 Tax=Mucilaginibacter sp. CSA2-8R TaxID=3141542 RepID=UPI00315D7097